MIGELVVLNKSICRELARIADGIQDHDGIVRSRVGNNVEPHILMLLTGHRDGVGPSTKLQIQQEVDVAAITRNKVARVQA